MKDDPFITGAAICRAMRRHRVTIRDLAGRLQMPQRVVRMRRRDGIQTAAAARDWLEAITGKDPGPLHERID